MAKSLLAGYLAYHSKLGTLLTTISPSKRAWHCSAPRILLCVFLMVLDAESLAVFFDHKTIFKTVIYGLVGM